MSEVVEPKERCNGRGSVEKDPNPYLDRREIEIYGVVGGLNAFVALIQFQMGHGEIEMSSE